MFVRAHDQRGLQRLQCRLGLVHRIAHPQPKIGRHLIVAAARGVEPSGRCTDQFGQPAFGRHVDVFEVPVFGDSACLIFGGHLIEALRDQRGVFRRHDPLRTKHGHMGL